jgi:hypothetical protein
LLISRGIIINVFLIKGQCQGNVISIEASPSKDECLQQCKDTEGCKWFTFLAKNEKKDSCILYRNCPTIDESCSNCISGESRCQEELSTTSTAASTTTDDSLGNRFIKNLFASSCKKIEEKYYLISSQTCANNHL